MPGLTALPQRRFSGCLQQEDLVSCQPRAGLFIVSYFLLFPQGEFAECGTERLLGPLASSLWDFGDIGTDSQALAVLWLSRSVISTPRDPHVLSVSTGL